MGRLEFLREVEESADPAAAAALDDAELEGMVEEKGEIFMKGMVNRERGGYREDKKKSKLRIDLMMSRANW